MKNSEGKLKIHATCIALFLIFGHIAMIFGMLDPSILGHEGGMEGMSHQFCLGSLLKYRRVSHNGFSWRPSERESVLGCSQSHTPGHS